MQSTVPKPSQAEDTHAYAHRWKTVSMQYLRTGFWAKRKLESPPGSTFELSWYAL